ncbi:ATP-binding protein [Maribacter sp. 2307ULW6-5]|uniref:ATP-binding protein n=1 Tax=Maribacter sp. 2307ULW6-5 TaxID=3386275 RepID=UPI0039BC300B
MRRIRIGSTLKIIFSYLVLIGLALLAAFLVYGELKRYMAVGNTLENETKLLMVNGLLTQLHEAEAFSKMALRSQKETDISAYLQKIDSVQMHIASLQGLSQDGNQYQLLDSLRFLLNEKVENNRALIALSSKDRTKTAIANALQQLDTLEASLGIITPEALVPNLATLPPRVRETIEKMAQLLNENVPETDTDGDATKKVDSLFSLGRNILKGVQNETALAARSLAKQENAMHATDQELSLQLRSILSSLEKELLVKSFDENRQREAVLRRSVQWAGIAAALGLLVAIAFVLMLNRDFWRAKTYRKQLEEEKSRTESLLENREQIIKMVSHDVRTPINTIFGNSELLASSDLTDRQREQVGQVRSAAHYVHRLVKDLLDLSQLEAGKLRPEKTHFDLGALISEVAERMALYHNKKSLALRLDIAPVQPLTIHSDSLRIRQILTNLLDNAHKFTDQGEIVVRARLLGPLAQGGAVEISISDTGRGIPEKQLHRIFMEFAQAHEETVGSPKGYGLGLTISKMLAQLLGGQLRVSSALGKGSVFTLTLPVAQDKGTAGQTFTTAGPMTNLAGSILVLEDDAPMRQLIVEQLARLGLEATALSGGGALHTLPDLNYDLVLTDIEMPGATGYEVLQQLRSGRWKHYREQPIVAMTGRQDLAPSELLAEGFSGVLRKPFGMHQLEKVLGTFLPLETPLPPSKPKSGSRNQEPFRTASVEAFLGNDSEALEGLLLAFEKDTKAHRAKLGKALKAKDVDSIGALAHKMLPMFRQLEVVSCIGALETLEKMGKGGTIGEIKPVLKALFPALDALLQALAEHRGATRPIRTD